MKVKNLNTQKREIAIVISSVTMLVVLILVVFFFSRGLSRKIEAVYTNPGNVGASGQDAKLEKYDEIIEKIFPDGLPKDLAPTASSTVLTP